MRRLRRFLATAILALSAAAVQSCTGFGGLKRLPDAQAVIAEMKFPKSVLTLAAAPDRADRTYRPGDRIGFSVRLGKPAYLAILEVRKSGETQLLFPNKAHPGGHLPANIRVSIPGPRDGFAILAPPPGTVVIEFVASTSGAAWLFHYAPAGTAIFADLGATTHLLAREIASALTHGGATAAAASVIIHVKGD